MEKIFSNQIIQEKLVKLAKDINSDIARIFPVVNYKGEQDVLDIKKNYLVLKMFKTIVDKIEQKYMQKTFVRVFDQYGVIHTTIMVDHPDIELKEFTTSLVKKENNNFKLDGYIGLDEKKISVLETKKRIKDIMRDSDPPKCSVKVKNAKSQEEAKITPPTPINNSNKISNNSIIESRIVDDERLQQVNYAEIPGSNLQKKSQNKMNIKSVHHQANLPIPDYYDPQPQPQPQRQQQPNPHPNFTFHPTSNINSSLSDNTFSSISNTSDMQKQP
jgi:hypothetical protein